MNKTEQWFKDIRKDTERKEKLHDRIKEILDKHGIEIRIESYDDIEVTFNILTEKSPS